MYSLYAIIIGLIIKNYSAEIIRLDDIKFKVNGAPVVTQTNNISTTPGSIQVIQALVSEDKKTAEKPVTDKINVVTEPAIELKPTEDQIKGPILPNKQNVPTKLNPQFKVTILKDIASTLTPMKKVSDNEIETRRREALNVYVPIIEDMSLRDDGGGNVKGIERSGLSLIETNGNVLRMPIVVV